MAALWGGGAGHAGAGGTLLLRGAAEPAVGNALPPTQVPLWPGPLKCGGKAAAAGLAGSGWTRGSGVAGAGRWQWPTRPGKAGWRLPRDPAGGRNGWQPRWACTGAAQRREGAKGSFLVAARPAVRLWAAGGGVGHGRLNSGGQALMGSRALGRAQGTEVWRGGNPQFGNPRGFRKFLVLECTKPEGVETSEQKFPDLGSGSTTLL